MKTLRPIAGAVTTPIAMLLSRTPLTPNAITVIGVLLNVGVAAVIALVDPRLGGLLSLGAGAFDMLDGALARATGQSSTFGAFLDSTLDRLSEGIVLFGVAAWGILNSDAPLALLAFAAMVGSFMVSYARARAEGLGATAEVGLLDRPARVIVLAIGLMLGLTVWALGIITLLTAVTTFQRIWFVRGQLDR